MEQKINNADQEKTNPSAVLKDGMEDLKSKYNIDQAAIDEARSVVGKDLEKIREYLTNNRGL